MAGRTKPVNESVIPPPKNERPDDLVMDALTPVKMDDGQEVQLTRRQLMFVTYYLENLDDKDAAIKAGYAPAYSTELLRNPNVSQVILNRVAKRNANSEITADNVEAKLWEIANGNINGKFNAEIEPKDRIAALKILHATRGGAKVKGGEKSSLVLNIDLGDGKMVTWSDAEKRIEDEIVEAEAKVVENETRE